MKFDLFRRWVEAQDRRVRLLERVLVSVFADPDFDPVTARECAHSTADSLDACFADLDGLNVPPADGADSAWLATRNAAREREASGVCDRVVDLITGRGLATPRTREVCENILRVGKRSLRPRPVSADSLAYANAVLKQNPEPTWWAEHDVSDEDLEGDE